MLRRQVPEARGRKPEAESQKPGARRQEPGARRKEAEARRLKAGTRRQTPVPGTGLRDCLKEKKMGPQETRSLKFTWWLNHETGVTASGFWSFCQKVFQVPDDVIWPEKSWSAPGPTVFLEKVLSASVLSAPHPFAKRGNRSIERTTINQARRRAYMGTVPPVLKCSVCFRHK